MVGKMDCVIHLLLLLPLASLSSFLVRNVNAILYKVIILTKFMLVTLVWVRFSPTVNRNLPLAESSFHALTGHQIKTLCPSRMHICFRTRYPVVLEQMCNLHAHIRHTYPCGDMIVFVTRSRRRLRVTILTVALMLSVVRSVCTSGRVTHNTNKKKLHEYAPPPTTKKIIKTIFVGRKAREKDKTIN